MNIVKVNLADLMLAQVNVRVHPRRQIEEYMRSLTMFGQTKNAVIDEGNNVLIGNGLVIAARELGWDEIDVVQRTDLTENQKLKLIVSDNKIFGLGVDNLDNLDVIFQQLVGDLDIPGYDEATLTTMIADQEAVSDEIAEYGVLTPEEINAIQNRPEPKTPSTQAKGAIDVQPTLPIMQAQSSNMPDANNSISVQCKKCGETLWLSKDVLLQLT